MPELTNIKENNKTFDITRGTKKLIKQAIEETKSYNRYVLCDWIAQTLVDKFKYKNYDYQLGRMGLVTSKDILKAIDTYIFRYSRANDFNAAVVPDTDIDSVVADAA